MVEFLILDDEVRASHLSFGDALLRFHLELFILFLLQLLSFLLCNLLLLLECSKFSTVRSLLHSSLNSHMLCLDVGNICLGHSQAEDTGCG